MNQINENTDRNDDETSDEDTVELVVLDMDQAVLGDSELAGARPPTSQVFTWLKHMESELDRLQGQWSQIDADLGERDARIAALLEEIEQREGALTELNAQLDERAAAAAAIESEIDSLQTALAEREAAIAAKDQQLGANGRDLAAARHSADELRASLASARDEILQLQTSGRQSRAEHDELMRRSAQLTQTNHGLLGKIQDLEAYIDGRTKDWAEQNAQLAKHRNDLAALERALKSKDKEGARSDKDKEELKDKVQELEQRCSALLDRGRERDDAYRDLEGKLMHQIEATEQLRSELSQSAAYTNEAQEEAEGRRRQIESLRAELEHRDRTIAELREAVASGQRSSADLAERQSGHLGRIAELEGALDQHAQNLERLVAELEEHKQRGVALDAQLKQRDEAADAFAAEALRRQQELDEVHRALAARQGEARRLEAELDERRQALSLLDKNMRRINVLGASLQRIDRRDKPPADLVPAAAFGGERSDSNVRYIGSPDGVAGSPRKMLVSLEGDGNLTFLLHKQNTTIGRSRRSDIRINGQFVSRIHARVLTHSIGTVIEDLGSKNGLLVNSQPVTRRVLQDGDIVSLGGKLDLKYVELDA
jgi:chromosome segregation ATPase